VKTSGTAILALGLVFALTAACRGDNSDEPFIASDELKARIMEAIRPPGKILHIKGRVGEPDWIDENPHTFEIWLDGDSDRFRTETRRQWPEGSAVHVAVGVGWEATAYDSEANQVDKQSIPTEYHARLRDPAGYRVAYLWALAMADEWRVLEEKAEGDRTIVVIEARGVEGRDVDPGTIPVTVVELDKDTLWPIRQSDRNILPGGQIEEGAVCLFDVVELLSPEGLPDDLFSPEAVESLYMNMEEKLQEATSQGFTLYWVGERYVPDTGGSALVLRDLGVRQSDPRWVSLTYSPESEWITSVIMREGTGSWSPNVAGGLGGYTSSDVAVRGVTGVLHTSHAGLGSPFPSHSLVLLLGGTTIELATVPMVKDGQDVNAFNDPEALLSLAEALVVAE